MSCVLCLCSGLGPSLFLAFLPKGRITLTYSHVACCPRHGVIVYSKRRQLGTHAYGTCLFPPRTQDLQDGRDGKGLVPDRVEPFR